MTKPKEWSKTRWTPGAGVRSLRVTHLGIINESLQEQCLVNGETGKEGRRYHQVEVPKTVQTTVLDLTKK